MKKNLTITWTMLILIAGMFITSCEKESYLMYDKNFTGIYFEKDSVYYSFGLTPFEIDSYEFELPVHLMGESSTVDRTFAIAVNTDKTTAVENVHYTLPATFTIKADSVNGYIPIKILRNEIGQADLKIAFQLKENDSFTPVNEKFKESSVYFNNRVERPSWVDYNGNPDWPTFKLGAWNPLTYIKFIELFRELEEISPATYKAMVAKYGVDLKTTEWGWFWDFDFTMDKYVVHPLYRYFMVDHKDLGVTIPKPSGFVN